MKRHHVFNVAAMFLCFLLFFTLASTFCGKTAHAQDNASKRAQEELKNISETIEKTLTSERENVSKLRSRLKDLKKSRSDFKEQITNYNLQISAYGKLLAPSTSIDELENAFAAQNTALGSITDRIKALTQKMEEIQARRDRTQDQFEINQQQLAGMRNMKTDDPGARALIGKLDTLTDLISTKRDVLKEMDRIYANRLGKLADIKGELSDLSQRFAEHIQQRRKEVLFEKKETSIVSLQAWKRMADELNFLADHSKLLINKQFWLDQFRFLRDSVGVLFFSSLLLFAIAEIVFLKLRRFCIIRQQQLKPGQAPWRLFTLQLLARSLPLFGAVAFLYTYARFQGFYLGVPVVEIGVSVLAAWLFTQWGQNFVKLWQERTHQQMPTRLAGSSLALIVLIRYFAVVYIVLKGIIPGDSVLLLLLRLLFEITLVTWTAWILRKFRKKWANAMGLPPKSLALVKSLIIIAGYVIAGGGLLIELTGYGHLALHWYNSWGRTAVVLLWACLFFFLIREWNASIRMNVPSSAQTELKATAKSLWWFLIRVSWIVWLGFFSICVLLAWGAEGPLIVAFFRVLNYRIPLGAIQLSLLGIVYAILILLFTRVVIHFWRILLEGKILADSGMEMGLQSSISRISVYLLWALGILVSLNVIGISAKSLAVIFGALGIGLGFGLQNIFSNFVSGLILLFERPIQVGDSVEVNGVWGSITKINVRATVVQTFDNASLIIPNSEFISSKVTNWTFKDLRLRRNIDVGVAYGSDTELTRDALLEIAGNHPKVLKYPKPDVLFVDFGDSSLVFRLRVWTTLDPCLQAETDIRFEIERLFRERNIEIAFPQRDVHVRSVET